jgi:hypothetical protein
MSAHLLRAASESADKSSVAELSLRHCCAASAVGADLVIAFGHEEPSRARDDLASHAAK